MPECSVQEFRERFPLAIKFAGLAPFEVPSRDWDITRDMLADWAVGSPTRPLSDLVPLLRVAGNTSRIDKFCVSEGIEPPRVRTWNLLVRECMTNWNALGELSLEQVKEWRGSGVVTVKDVLRLCCEFGIRWGRTATDTFSQFDGREAPLTSTVLLTAPIAALETLAEWCGALNVKPEVASVISHRDSPEIDEEVRQSIDDLMEWQLSAARQRLPSLGDRLEALGSSLGERERHVLNHRLLQMSELTLKDLGETFGVSRERVRQIADSVDLTIEERLSTPEFRSLRWIARSFRARSRGVYPEGTTGSTFDDFGVDLVSLSALQRRMFLRFPCRMRLQHGWWSTTEADSARERVVSEVNSNGSASLTEVASHFAWPCDSVGLREFAASTGEVAWFEDLLLSASASIETLAAFVLSSSGLPMSVDSIHERLRAAWRKSPSESSLRNALGNSERFVRASSVTWGLVEWGMPRFESTFDSICREIDQGGGRRLVAEVLKTIVGRDGVKEGTVRAYLKAPRFVLEGEYVRFRRDDEPFLIEQRLKDVEGAYAWSDSKLSWSFELNEDSLRGSGRLLPMAIAEALGVAPTVLRLFDAGDGVTLRVNWPDSGWQGANLGSHREAAERTCAAVGDHLRIDFDRQKMTATCSRVPPSAPNLGREIEWLAVHTGCGPMDPSSIVSALARAIGVSRAQVFSALRGRGDGLVAEVLQRCDNQAAAPGPGLDAFVDAVRRLGSD
jgi:hypothetical protein